MESDTKNLYECVVIGGGIAGAATAYHLAGLGHEVAVLERTKGPHHKVCGEFLSFETVAYLQEMGMNLGDEMPVIKYFRLCSPSSQTDFIFPRPGRGMSRYKLDEELLYKAKQAGANLRRGICVRATHRVKNVWKIETNAGDFYAKYVFMATGKHDHAREFLRYGKDNSYLGFKVHLRLKSPGQLKERTILFSFPDGYAGICPIESGRMNFCFIITKEKHRNLGCNMQNVVDFLRHSNPYLESVLAQADFLMSVSAIGHIPYGFLRRCNENDEMYFMGDQRAVIPSFTGDGMAIALSTAKNTAYAFDARQKGLYVESDKIDHTLNSQMQWAFWAQALLKSQWLIKGCAVVPGLGPFLIGQIFNRTRIYENTHPRH